MTSIKDSGETTRPTGKENTCMKMALLTKVSGWKTCNTVVAMKRGQKEESMRVNMLMARSVGKAL